MVTRTITILQQMLQNCYCACDHFWTSDTKGLKLSVYYFYWWFRDTPPTLRYRDFREDFIWDEESEDGIENANVEPEYEVAGAPPITNDSVEPQKTNPTYTVVEPHQPSSIYASMEPCSSRMDDTTCSTPSRYASVEPYQGQKVALSPLVKLRGVPKKKRKRYK